MFLATKVQVVTATRCRPRFPRTAAPQLADAALSAAIGAGASYADLRLHQLSNETVHLRDGKLRSRRHLGRGGFRRARARR